MLKGMLRRRNKTKPPKPDGKPKKYFYNGRMLQTGGIDYTVVMKWLSD
jgi:hypothetical protein